MGDAVIGVEAYDAAECVAADRYCNRIVQAFYPEMFATLGYPSRVKSVDQLWRYIDVMHETRTLHNIEYLLRGLTTEEFGLFKRVTRMVDEFAQRQFGFRAHPTAALLRAIHVLRLIKIVTGNERPTVLEVGPGCGYLGMLLVMEGYPYVGTDVVQAFYLYQSHMLSLAATNFRELAGEEGDILSLEQPKPGTAIHIPWWKWVTLTPEKVKLSAGIMTSNHVMCEMHQSSMAYMAVIGNRILSNHLGGGKFIFENWGYDLLHSKESVANKFAEHGLRLCHDEYFMSAMVLADEVERWHSESNSKQAAPAAALTPVTDKVWIDRWPRLRRLAGAALAHTPTFKRRAIYTVHAIERLFQRPPSEPLPFVEGPKGEVFPLSKQLTEGRNAVIARATIHEPEVRSFLESHFGGAPPRVPDEVFFDLIGTRQ